MALLIFGLLNQATSAEVVESCELEMKLKDLLNVNVLLMF